MTSDQENQSKIDDLNMSRRTVTMSALLSKKRDSCGQVLHVKRMMILKHNRQCADGSDTSENLTNDREFTRKDTFHARAACKGKMRILLVTMLFSVGAVSALECTHAVMLDKEWYPCHLHSIGTKGDGAETEKIYWEIQFPGIQDKQIYRIPYITNKNQRRKFISKLKKPSKRRFGKPQDNWEEVIAETLRSIMYSNSRKLKRTYYLAEGTNGKSHGV